MRCCIDQWCRATVDFLGQSSGHSHHRHSHSDVTSESETGVSVASLERDDDKEDRCSSPPVAVLKLRSPRVV